MRRGQASAYTARILPPPQLRNIRSAHSPRQHGIEAAHAHPLACIRTHGAHLDTVGKRADDPRVGVGLDIDRRDFSRHHKPQPGYPDADTLLDRLQANLSIFTLTHFCIHPGNMVESSTVRADYV
jgi:hypothetical protein